MKRKLMAFIALFIASILIFSTSKIYGASAEAGENEVSVNAKAYLLADFDTGKIVCSRDENQRYPIASMVKIMTLNLIFEQIESGNLLLDDKITVSTNASSMGGSQAFLDPNCQYKAEDLIKSIIVASANDSCVAMAEHISGSVEAFVYKMNEKANLLGMKDTNFVNCTGLPAPNSYSCAIDVMKMTKVLASFDKFFDYSQIWTFDLVHPSGRSTTLTNTNKLSRFYNGCDGGKTGYTNEAGSCLSATAKRGDTRFICVVIGANSSKERNAEVSKLLDYGFANYCTEIALSRGELDRKIEVSDGIEQDISVFVDKNVCIFGKKQDLSGNNVEIKLCCDGVAAPVEKGQVVGKVEVYLDGKLCDCANLIANESVRKMQYLDWIKRIVEKW